MKFSLRWITYHLSLEWHEIDVEELLRRFNTQVAEIEQVETVSLSVDTWSFVAADGISGAVRPPLSGQNKYLACSTPTGMRWVTLRDMGLDKDGFAPAVHVPAGVKTVSECWDEDDIILTVDNKSMTHRPDMWGHRGFAREIAAVMGYALCPEAEYVTRLEHHFNEDVAAADLGIELRNADPERCGFLSALRVTVDAGVGCNVRMMSRFVKIGYRPINALIDATNYVMADWGRPMHAFEATALRGNLLQVRRAQADEKLELLDGSMLTLTSEDVVVADGEGALGLAGIMGGKRSGVSDRSTEVLLEAATFDAAAVRRSAARHKVRTEASQRFEKTLNGYGAVQALERFVAVANASGLNVRCRSAVAALGAPKTPSVLTMTHAFVQNRLGIDISSAEVVALLQSLEFGVVQVGEGASLWYQVAVPFFRAVKDITSPLDLIEEIARLYGFSRITATLPAIAKKPSALEPVLRERRIKEYLAYGCGMQEQRNYAFYDEQVIAQLAWPVTDALELVNPVSVQAYRLVGSLLPHLCNNVIDNWHDAEQLRFFEWGRVWGSEPTSEHTAVAGLWYAKRGGLSFYALKEQLQTLCRLAYVTPTWQHAQSPPVCFEQGLTAQLMVGQTLLGYFGKVDALFAERMGALPESILYAFELDATFLQQTPVPAYQTEPLSKYQTSSFDVSALMPYEMTVAACEEKIQQCSPLIVAVRLIDFFEKKEWTDRRSLAFRVTIGSGDANLTRDEVEIARQAVITAVRAAGGELRG